MRPFPLIIEVLRKRSLQRRRRWRLQRQRQFVLMRVWHDRKRYQSAEETAALDPATGGANPRGYLTGVGRVDDVEHALQGLDNLELDVVRVNRLEGVLLSDGVDQAADDVPHDCHPRIVSDHDSRTLQAFIFGHQCFVSAAAAANRWSAQSSTSHATLTTATIICRSSSAAARSSGDSGDVDSSKESDSSRQARIHAVLDRRADNDCCSKDQRRKAQRDDERHTFILSSRASPGRALAIVSTAVGARCFRASPANPVRPGTHCASAGRAGKWPTAAARGRGQPAGFGGRGSHRRRSHLLLGGGAVPLHGLRFHDGRS